MTESSIDYDNWAQNQAAEDLADEQEKLDNEMENNEL